VRLAKAHGLEALRTWAMRRAQIPVDLSGGRCHK
jgi:hypothetical protein